MLAVIALYVVHIIGFSYVQRRQCLNYCVQPAMYAGKACIFLSTSCRPGRQAWPALLQCHASFKKRVSTLLVENLLEIVIKRWLPLPAPPDITILQPTGGICCRMRWYYCSRNLSVFCPLLITYTPGLYLSK